MTSLFQGLKSAFLSLLPVFLLGLALQFCLGFMDSELLWRWIGGAALAATGLFLFLRGIDFCLLPLGEMIGARLLLAPRLLILLGIVFIAGVAANSADPSVAVLAGHVKSVSVASGPPPLLVMSAVVGGIAFFLCLGVIRIMLGWPIPLTLGIGYGLTIALGCFVPPGFAALAFDSGGVATGPLTVPFFLAIGMGLSSVLGSRSDASGGFGLLGLVALGPMLGVMILGIFW